MLYYGAANERPDSRGKAERAICAARDQCDQLYTILQVNSRARQCLEEPSVLQRNEICGHDGYQYLDRTRPDTLNG